MSKEEFRAGFEAWHCEQYKTKHMTGAPTRDMHNGVRDENYCSKKSQALWECWQETGGDVAKVEALKEEIERIELAKQPVALLMLGDIFHGADGPEVDDWDIQYDHKVCEVLAQANPGAQIPLFTRSDADVIERLNTVVEQQKNMLASLRAELTDSYSINDEDLRAELETLRQQHAEQSCIFCNNSGELLSQVKSLRAQLADAAQSLETISAQAGRDEFMKDMTDVRGYANSRARVAREGLGVIAEPACQKCGGSGFIAFEDRDRKAANNGFWGRCLTCRPYSSAEPTNKESAT